MKISEAWLREWVNPDISTEELAEQLTMAGLEVDAVELAAPEFSKVVVAEVLTVKPHPDADKLRVCTVNAGGDELQIVCGASNVREGLKVPAALVGAKLPGDFKIKKSKLRGELSLGMLCGASELGLEESSDGLMELPDDAPVGTDIREYLNLNDKIIEVDLTPNRGDCLSIRGVAREVAVMNTTDVKPLVFDLPAESVQDSIKIDIKAKQACPRYLGRIIKGVNPGASTPDWMQDKLRKGGVRPLSPLVDVTNYVLLELGHPMHAFDLDKIEGGIVVRQAKKAEKLVLLDEKEIELQSESLVIADNKKALALAGIMGGLESSVTDSTNDILLECAFFTPSLIAGKARSYSLHTDSSHRFERGVDPEQLEHAMQRATQLVIDICGGQAGPIVQSDSAEHLPEVPQIRLRHQQLNRILGIDFNSQTVENILTSLEMKVGQDADGWIVTPPSFRFDMAIEADLIEDIARIYGYNQLPTKAFTGAMHMYPVSEQELTLDAVQQDLFARGYHEVITYSFVDPDVQILLDPEAEAIALANPISSDMAVMRTSLWPGLVQALLHNQKRQQERIRIFESGLKFIKQDNEIKQINVVSGCISGNQNVEQWADKGRSVDFFDVKGDVESLLALTAQPDQFSFVAKVHPALHPGQSAVISRAGKECGWLGRLHPKLQQKLGLKDDVFLFELHWDALVEVGLPSFSPISKFPSIRRDLALLVDESVTSDQITTTISSILDEILKEIVIFDVYKGKGVDSGRKSVALGLILQESSRTLTDQDVEASIAKIVAELEKQLGATLRD